MKKIFFGLILLAGVSVTNVNAQTGVNAIQVAKPSSMMAVISFAVDNHEFGTVPQGTPVSYVFSFKNTGKEPLILSSVSASCGCTTPEWPKDAVAPNATAKITVTYNAANVGPFTKTVTVVSNAVTPTTVLTIHGEVKAASAATSASVPAAAPKTAATPKKS